MINLMIHSVELVPVAFSSAMIHSVWISGLLYIILRFVLDHILSERWSHTRYYFSMFLMFLAGISLPVIFAVVYNPNPESEGPGLILAGGQGICTGEGRLEQLQLSPANSISRIMIQGYLLGLLIFTVRWLAGNFRLMSLRGSSVSVPPVERGVIESVRNKIGYEKYLRVRKSAYIDTPLVWGLFRPTVMVPLGFFTNMPACQAESLLIHELMHIRKYDHIIILFQSILELFLFYNPFIWLISREIKFEREKCIDDMVLEICPDPAAYATALYQLSLLKMNRFSPVPAASGNSRKPLLIRVQRILNIKTPNMKTQTKSRPFITIVTVVSTSAILLLSGFMDPMFTKHHKRQVPESDFQLTVAPDQEPKISQNTVYALSDTIIQIHTIRDTLTKEEWMALKRDLEHAYKELESLDLDREFQRLETEKQEMLKEARERLKEQQFMVQEEMEKLKSEAFKRQMELSMREADSIRMNIDADKIAQELKKQEEMLRKQLEEAGIESEEFYQQLEEALKAIESIDTDKIVADIDVMLKEIDYELDYDIDVEIDFNAEKIMEDLEKSMNDIDFEEIRIQIGTSKKQIEQQLQELESKKNIEDPKK